MKNDFPQVTDTTVIHLLRFFRRFPSENYRDSKLHYRRKPGLFRCFRHPRRHGQRGRQRRKDEIRSRSWYSTVPLWSSTFWPRVRCGLSPCSHRLDIPRRFLSPAAGEEEEWAVAVTSNARTQPEYQYVRQFWPQTHEGILGRKLLLRSRQYTRPGEGRKGKGRPLKLRICKSVFTHPF